MTPSQGFPSLPQAGEDTETLEEQLTIATSAIQAVIADLGRGGSVSKARETLEAALDAVNAAA